jgi:hypothetical protein
MNMTFDGAYSGFMKYHVEQRKGERLRRLQEGHGHAEKLFLEQVWWPAFGQFSHLHPEFEVSDFKDGYRYLDFAYIRPFFRVALEIDGYGPHWRNLSRWQFSDQWQRQNHLIIDGWRVMRFTYDDVKEKPRLCQQTIQQFMGRWLGEEKSVDAATYVEKEIVRIALQLSRPITPEDVCGHMGIENKYARKLLHSLVEKKWLHPASGNARIRSYRLDLEGKNYML